MRKTWHDDDDGDEGEDKARCNTVIHKCHQYMSNTQALSMSVRSMPVVPTVGS